MAIEKSAKEGRLGANRLPDGSWEFVLWAPMARTASVVFSPKSGEPLTMDTLGAGYYRTVVTTLPGSEYFYRLDDGRELPDPASRYQPEGVHGRSQVVDV